MIVRITVLSFFFISIFLQLPSSPDLPVCLQEHKLPLISAIVYSMKVRRYSEHINTGIKEVYTRKSSFTDIDGDGYIDPVIVYGSKTEDDEVQRVKIISISISCWRSSGKNRV